MRVMSHVSFDFSKIFPPELPLRPEQIALVVRRGSHAYGTSVDGSDEDIAVVYVPTEMDLLGFHNLQDGRQVKHSHSWPAPTDGMAHSLQQAFRLGVSSNPTIFETLGVSQEDVLYETEVGARLRAYVPKFLSRRVAKSFYGFAEHNYCYDREGTNPKALMHSMRLLLMAKEILTEGKLLVKRPDREALLKIRLGMVPAHDVRADLHRLIAELPALAEISALPDQANVPDALRECMDLTKLAWGSPRS